MAQHDHMASDTDANTASLQDQLAGQITEGVGQLVRGVANTDFAKLSRDAGAFAKRHPVLVLGGAALAGLAAAHLLSAQDQGRGEASDTDATDDPWMTQTPLDPNEAE